MPCVVRLNEMVAFDANEALTPCREGRGIGAILFDRERLRQAEVGLFSPQHWGSKARRNDTLPMGTTVVAARVQGNRYEVAWVGDSRAYLWRDGQLAQLSQDHSVVQELVAQGNLTAEQARAHPHRNVVTQALGVTDPAHLNVATTSGELRPAACRTRWGPTSTTVNRSRTRMPSGTCS